MRAVGVGEKDGRAAKVTVDLDALDPATEFTGMERLTGWHAAIMMAFEAQLDRRGIPHSVRWE
jgi:hypothetical protein